MDPAVQLAIQTHNCSRRHNELTISELIADNRRSVTKLEVVGLNELQQRPWQRTTLSLTLNNTSPSMNLKSGQLYNQR